MGGAIARILRSSFDPCRCLLWVGAPFIDSGGLCMSGPGQSDSRWWISSLLERVSLVQAGRKMAGRKRTALMVAALENVEKRFGNMESLVDPAVHSVATLPDGRITRSALEKLFSHQVSAVRVPNFYPVSASRKLAETFLKSKDAWGKNWKVSSSRGMESSDVDSIGTPYNVALGGGAEAVKKYFDDAELLRQQLRENGGQAMVDEEEAAIPSVYPTLTPIDLLRLQLDETWPDGATVGKDKQTGRALLAGAGRIMRGEKDRVRDGAEVPKFMDGFCHVDDLSVMGPTGGLFSANVYLRTPQYGGGELKIWPLTIKSRLDFLKNSPTLSALTSQDVEGQIRLRQVLPRPLTIEPEEGELVLLCAQRPHAAVGFRSGVRVSMQTFITFDQNKPLVLDN